MSNQQGRAKVVSKPESVKLGASRRESGPFAGRYMSAGLALPGCLTIVPQNIPNSRSCTRRAPVLRGDHAPPSKGKRDDICASI